ncbi:hypothetical protein BHE74_00058961 [Ensete ventricosum]|nr:hypothetical protein BHE74_00058961 [Ensete ventricosum]
MVLKVSEVVGERCDRTKWEVLRNDRKSCAKLTEVRELLTQRIWYSCKGLYMDDGVFVAIPRHDQNSALWSIRTFSSIWKGYVCRRLKCAISSVIQLAEAKLGSGYLSTGQEDAEAGTLEEYATRRVFVCALELALDESLSHQHMGAVYHRGRSPNESLGRQHMGAVYHRGSSQIASTSESHGGDLIIVSPTSQRTKPKLLGGHSGVKAGGRKGRGSDDESSGAQLPKSKASVRKEVDSEEHDSAAEADLPIAKEGMHM